MSNDSGATTPVWARTKKSGGGMGGLFGFIFFLLALFGLLMAILAGVNHGSFAKAGAQVDGVVCSIVARVHGGQAKPAAAEAAPAPASSAMAPAAAPKAVK